MKPIIVNEKNADRIMAEFYQVQGRARARTIDLFEQLVAIIEDIDERLAGIPKKALEGTKVEYTFAQKFPNAYKYRPESTHFSLWYSKGAWRITAVGRYTCPNRSGYPYSLDLSDTAKAAVLKLYE